MSCKMSKKSAAKTQAATASPAPAAPEKAPVVPTTSVPEQASSPAPKKGNGKTTAKSAEPHPLKELVEAAILIGKSTALSSACQAVGVSMKGDVEERKARLQAWLDGKPVATAEPASSPAGKPADAKPTTEKPAKPKKLDQVVTLLKVMREMGCEDPNNAVTKDQILAKATPLGVHPTRLYTARNPEQAGLGKDPLIAKPKIEGSKAVAYITAAGLAFLKTHAPELFGAPAPAEEPAPKKAKKAKTK